jgi:TPR repeat protein
MTTACKRTVPPITSAEYNLGYCYSYGRGVVQDIAQAFGWYRKAAEHGDVDAQFTLGYCYEQGRGVGKDIAQAQIWYRQAAEQGHKRAVNALARLLAKPKSPVQEPEPATETGYWVIAPYSVKPQEDWEQAGSTIWRITSSPSAGRTWTTSLR